jgi:hypothetical protein
MFADYLSQGLPLTFSQSEVTKIGRKRIASALLSEEVQFS